MELPNETFFPHSNHCYDQFENVFYPFSAVVRETYSFIKIMQPISLNYNWEDGVKQIQITEENLSEKCILCQFVRTKALASGLKCMEHFFFSLFYFSTTICLISVEWMGGCDLWFIEHVLYFLNLLNRLFGHFALQPP